MVNNKIKDFFTIKDDPKIELIVYNGKKEEGRMISGIIVFLLIIAILNNFASLYMGIHGIMNGGEINVKGNVIVNMGLAIYGTVVSALTITVLVLILAKKKIGVIAFYVLSVLNMIVMYSLLGGDFFIYFIPTLMQCAVMTGLLFIRRNKRSAWSVIFNKEGRK